MSRFSRRRGSSLVVFGSGIGHRSHRRNAAVSGETPPLTPLRAKAQRDIAVAGA